jgi:hypothetical protein
LERQTSERVVERFKKSCPSGRSDEIEDGTDLHSVDAPPWQHRRRVAKTRFSAGSTVAVKLTNKFTRHRTDLSKTDKL